METIVPAPNQVITRTAEPQLVFRGAQPLPEPVEPADTDPTKLKPLPNEHWNDAYLLHDGSFPYAHEDDLTPEELQAYDTAMSKHYGKLWEQEQALLDVAVARVEGREPTMTAQEMQELDIPPNAIKNNYGLASALFRRMGPNNEMARSDAMLTALSGLVVEEVAERSGVKFDEAKTKNPLLAAHTRISAFAGALRERPELAEGQEGQLLLAAEMLGEALRSPDSVRGKYSPEGGVPEKIEEGYIDSIVTFSEAAFGSLAKKLDALNERIDENSSRKQLNKRREITSNMQRALLTKYDALFDALGLDATPEQSEKILSEMISETLELAPSIESGFLYELYVPIMFRYAATKAGNIGTERIWHAAVRSDTPDDKIGNRPKEEADDAALALQRHKKGSSDVQLGRIKSEDSPYGKILARWQLKARTDAANFVEEYDGKFVDIHSSDAVKLFDTAARLNAQYDPNSKTLTDQERIDKLDEVLHQLLTGILQEVQSEVDGVQGHSAQQVDVSGTKVNLDFSEVLDSIAPEYAKLVER